MFSFSLRKQAKVTKDLFILYLSGPCQINISEPSMFFHKVMNHHGEIPFLLINNFL